MPILALVIGIVAGLRSMTAPAAIAWAAGHRLSLEGTWLAPLGWRFAPWLLTLLAVGELVGDKLPMTPARTVPVAFAGRIVAGGVSGMAIGYGGGAPVVGLVLGIAGAIAGTLGGAAARRRLAVAFGRDRPAALIEDAVALAGAVLVFAAL